MTLYCTHLEPLVRLAEDRHDGVEAPGEGGVELLSELCKGQGLVRIEALEDKVNVAVGVDKGHALDGHRAGEVVTQMFGKRRLAGPHPLVL